MNIDNLVYDRPDLGKFQVHRSSMTSPDIYELERRRIFDRCWLYLGHESEVPNPGDYARRVVAERALFFARDRQGELRVFHNTCPHRGALICRTDHGNAQVLQCFYHAWSFNTSGELIGMPDIEGYGPDFDRADFSLRSPRYESYQGFIFVCFDPDAGSLREYLAGAAEYLDLVADQAPEGMKVIPGSNRYTIKANWKLPRRKQYRRVSCAAHAPDLFRLHGQRSRQRHSRHQPPPRFRPGAGQWARRHGKTTRSTGRPIAMWHPYFGEEARDEINSIKDELIARHGHTKALRIVREEPEHGDFPQPGNQRHHGGDHPRVPAHGPGQHGRDGVADGSRRRDRLAVEPPPGLFPHFPGARRIRHSGRHGGAGIVPAGVPFRGRGMVRSVARLSPGPAGQRRAPIALVLASLAVPGRRPPPRRAVRARADAG